MIHEIKQVLWVEHETFGAMRAMFIIDYGCEANTVWVCAVKKDGAIKHFDSNQIKVERNYTLEENLG
jgi:phosphoribosyl-AMP cyclohydrolase